MGVPTTPTPTILSDRLRGWLRRTLPVRLPALLLDLAEGGCVVDEQGHVHAPLLAARLDDEGEIIEVAEEHVAVLHAEDLADGERSVAFLAGWAEGLPALALMLGWGSGPSTRTAAHALRELGPPWWLLDDLELVGRDDFAREVSRGSWLDSGPDHRLFPDLADLRGTEPRAIDPERERQLAAAPTREGFLEYAQWLCDHGDVRGELIQAQAGGTRRDARRASQLLRRHQRYFLGNFPTGVTERFASEWYADEIELGWRWGYIVEARLELTLDPDGPRPRTMIGALFRLPSTCLHTLRLRIADNAWENPEHYGCSRWTEELLAAGACSTLRTLELEPPRVDLLEGAAEAPAEDTAALRRHFPSLRTLLVGGVSA